MTKLFRKIERTTLAICILTICFISLINVVCRSLFGFSLSFVEELNQYLIIGTTFIGCAYGVRVGRHIRMSAIFDLLSQKNKKLFCFGMDLVCASLFYYLAYLSVEYILIVAKLGSVGPALRVPKALVYSIVPLGFFNSATLYLLTFYKNLTHSEVYLSLERKLEAP